MIATGEGDLGTPPDITVDLAGYVYVVDAEHAQVVRYRSNGQGFGEFVQRVDIEPNKVTGIPLAQPIAVAADDELVYVADAARSELAIFRRRK
jgi:DNA-binding beta-propeller fold protein YncE